MRNYLIVSGVIFALVAVGHLVRTVLRWPLVIAGRPLPAAISIVVTLASAAMSIWAWRSLKRMPGNPS